MCLALWLAQEPQTEIRSNRYLPIHSHGLSEIEIVLLMSQSTSGFSLHSSPLASWQPHILSEDLFLDNLWRFFFFLVPKRMGSM